MTEENEAEQGKKSHMTYIRQNKSGKRVIWKTNNT